MNSIIVAKDDNWYHDPDVSGDRVRFTEVSEYDDEPWYEDIIKDLNGARFVIEHVFYSLKEYKTYPQYFKKTFIPAKEHALNNPELCITFKESFKRKHPSIANDI
jgi:hypothetical protein